jgi:hypothetical protein
MIERARELQVPLSELANTVPDLPELSGEEWKLLKIIAQVLSIFKDAAQELSATSHPTLNEAVLVYNYIFDELEDFHQLCGDEANSQADNQEYVAIINQCSPAMKRALSNAIEAAHCKMRKYYAKTWAGMYAIALVLDPRFKMDYCEKKGWEPEHIAHVRDAIQRTVEQVHGGSVPSSGPCQSDTTVHRNRLTQRLDRDMKQSRMGKESEMEKYMAASTIHAEADVLAWWRLSAHDYPCLARIARDYLSIPATSAPVERVFSGGADLITKKRGSLNEDTIRDCMCLKSWLA